MFSITVGPALQTLGPYLGGLITLAAFSYLYKETPLYRWAEYTYIGIITANGIVVQWFTYIKPRLENDLIGKGQYSLIIPVLIGLLIYTRYFKSVSFLSKIPMSLWVGYGMGYVLAFGIAPFFTQVTNTFVKFSDLNQVIFFISAISVMSYFIFTIKTDSGVLKYPSILGKFILLVSFGAFFAYNVMSYGSLIMGRAQYLLGDVLKIIQL